MSERAETKAFDRTMRTALLGTAWTSCSRTLLDTTRFIVRPNLANSSKIEGKSRLTTGFWLYVFSLFCTGFFLVVALPLLLRAEAAPGDGLSSVLGGSVLSVMVALLLLGPLIEEFIFRGWLSGTWRSMLATVLTLFVVYGGSSLLTPWIGTNSTLKSLLLLAVAVAAIWATSPLDDGARLPFFGKLFPFIFWGQGIAFGALHFQNLTTPSPALATLSIMPLILCGWLWGYARLRLGVGWAILLHAAYNVPAGLGAIILAT